MRATLIFLLLVSLGIAGPVTMDVGKGDIAIAYDPRQPNDKISIVWLSYCIGRLHYVVEHRREYPQKISGDLLPKFKEEVAGRFVGLDTYKNMVGRKFAADAYWEAVQTVFEAGFLDEYVWTYFHREAWPAAEKPAKMNEFETWAKSHLIDHSAVTHGTLVGKKG